MNADWWVISWGGPLWTNAPVAALANVEGAVPVTLAHYAQVAKQLGTDDWSACEPLRSPTVLAAWIAVLGVEIDVWADLRAAWADLVAEPIATLAACVAPLTGEE